MAKLKLRKVIGHKYPRFQSRMIAVSHYVSYGLASKLPDVFPILFVTGYPKSGTVWVCQVVSDYLGLPFANQSLLPVGMHCVMHGHQRIWPEGPPAVYVTRDGRDTMVSMYFYMLRALPNPDAGFRELPGHIRPYFQDMHDLKDIRGNMPTFIERQMARPLGSKANWHDHVRTSLDSEREDVPFVKYEDMLADGPGTLAKAMRTLTGDEPDMDRCRQSIDKFAFKKQTGRASGSEDKQSFLRKGQAGDWRNHFSKESAEVFDQHAGDTLIALGYENDRGWIQTCS